MKAIIEVIEQAISDQEKDMQIWKAAEDADWAAYMAAETGSVHEMRMEDRYECSHLQVECCRAAMNALIDVLDEVKRESEWPWF